jgi:hypothetical protein
MVLVAAGHRSSGFGVTRVRGDYVGALPGCPPIWQPRAALHRGFDAVLHPTGAIGSDSELALGHPARRYSGRLGRSCGSCGVTDGGAAGREPGDLVEHGASAWRRVLRCGTWSPTRSSAIEKQVLAGRGSELPIRRSPQGRAAFVLPCRRSRRGYRQQRRASAPPPPGVARWSSGCSSRRRRGVMLAPGIRPSRREHAHRLPPGPPGWFSCVLEARRARSCFRRSNSAGRRLGLRRRCCGAG